MIVLGGLEAELDGAKDFNGLCYRRKKGRSLGRRRKFEREWRALIGWQQAKITFFGGATKPMK